MSALGNIIKKEIRELLTPATFLPVVIIAIIFGSLGSSIQGVQEGAKEKPIVGLINEDNSTLSAVAADVINKSAKIVFNSTSESDKQLGLDAVKKEKGIALIVIPNNFTEEILNNRSGPLEVYWIMQGAGLMDSISSSVVEYLITNINTNISTELIQRDISINATVVLSPTQRVETTYFKDREFKGLSPNTLNGMLSSQSLIVPIIMMLIIMMAGSIVITSMALEKENKTLETLLTLPVKRTSIVTGKIIAAAIIGLILAVIYMIGMGYYFQGLQISQGGVDLADYGLALKSQDFLLMGVSLFVTLIAALSLCMLLGTFAKNYKSIQTLTFPIAMFALIPMFITMFTDFDNLPLGLKGLVFAIPFSHTMMAPKALLFGDYLFVISGIAYVAIFAIVMIIIVVWIFKTDRLLTGSTRMKKLKGQFLKIKKF